MTIEIQQRNLSRFFRRPNTLPIGFKIEHSDYQYVDNKFRKITERVTVKTEDLLHDEILIVNPFCSDLERAVEDHEERVLFRDQINQDTLLLAGSDKRIVWKR